MQDNENSGNASEKVSQQEILRIAKLSRIEIKEDDLETMKTNVQNSSRTIQRRFGALLVEHKDTDMTYHHGQLLEQFQTAFGANPTVL